MLIAIADAAMLVAAAGAAVMISIFAALALVTGGVVAARMLTHRSVSAIRPVFRRRA
jgi:hypothetical protein